MAHWATLVSSALFAACFSIVFGLLARYPHLYLSSQCADGRDVGTQGVWGNVTSSVDWCEPNYAAHGWVAEMWNTVSSLAITFAGAAACYTVWSNGVETRFALLCGALAVVGLGSVCFHATLQHEHQMLDEVPMLWLALQAVYCLSELGRDRPKRRWLPAVLVVWGCMASWGTITGCGSAQLFFFHFSFLALELAFLMGSICLCHRSTCEQNKLLLRVALLIYPMAMLAWAVDNAFCVQLQQGVIAGAPYPQLHAVGWHCGIAAASYLLIVGTVVEHRRAAGHMCRTEWRWGFPRVVAAPKPHSD
eukprot:TRINITY_DN52261_c0_g1_i1.p1 TRINITY_DN52261_c0_g1~~TRINITY_DN52261_c0_g1_i1.p1  ORF type:complete len:329 (+),score=82.41 TRINITY_DN52261_c0_g1_i1:75-989(+)